MTFHHGSRRPERQKSLENVELVLFLGVLEYVDRPLKHLGHVASLSKRMVVSYNVFERRSRLKKVTAGVWKSALRDEDLRQAFTTYGYHIEAFIEMGRESLYLVKPQGAQPLGAGRRIDETDVGQE